MSLLELIKAAEGMQIIDEDQNSDTLKLLPGLSDEEISTLERKLLAAIPSDVKALLAYTSGFENGPLESVDFTGALSFEMEELFPHGRPIAHDGFGNYWVIDLTSGSTEWGPIFFACHDPPVIVYQAANLLHFMEDVIRYSNPPHKADLDEVHEKYSMKVWKQNPGVLSREECAKSKDMQLRAFAESLGGMFQIIDLRNPKLGDGFSWGRYGPQTVVRRHGQERIFAYEVRKSVFGKLFGN
jgi:cell wall assembly regulator SMI1